MRTYQIGEYKVEIYHNHGLHFDYDMTKIALGDGRFLTQNSDEDWWTLCSENSRRYINFNIPLRGLDAIANNGIRLDMVMSPEIPSNKSIEIIWTNGKRGFEIYHDGILRTTLVEKFDNFCCITKTRDSIRYRTNDYYTIIFANEKFIIEGRFDFGISKEERIATLVKELKFSNWKKAIKSYVLRYKEKRRKIIRTETDKYLFPDLSKIIIEYT